jgi:hypothetical protein
MKFMDKIVERVSKTVTKEVFTILDKKKKEEHREPSILEQLMKNPEGFKLEAWIKNEEITIKIKKDSE